MASTQVGQDHIIAGIIHVQILRDTSAADPSGAFSAQITGPGFSETLPIANGQSKEYSLAGVHIGGLPANPTIRVEVDNFRLVPPGATSADASALAFLLVFKLVEIFQITIGSVPVSAALH